MKSIHLRILAVMAALVLAATALAQAHGHGGPVGGDFQHLLGFYTKQLDLSSEQQEQIKAIWAKEKPTIKTAMQQMGQFRNQMRPLEEAGTFDEVKVRAVAAQQSQAMTEMIVQKARIKSEMLQVLTAEQRAKLTQLETQREQRMQQHLQQRQQSQDSTSN